MQNRAGVYLVAVCERFHIIESLAIARFARRAAGNRGCAFLRRYDLVLGFGGVASALSLCLWA
jgi:hypothetical protein